MSAERSFPGRGKVKPPLSVDELEKAQGLAGKPLPDLVKILEQMWPTPEDADRSLDTLNELDAMPKGRRDLVNEN